MNRSMTAILVALCAWAPVPAAHAAEGPSGSITSYGIYAYSLANAHKTESGTNVTYTQIDPVLAVTSDTIPLLKGIYFGYKFKLEGLPSGTVKLTWTVRHPPFPKADGSPDTGYSLVRKVRIGLGGFTGNSGYILSDDNEMVPGDWTLSYSYNGKVLVTKTFHVVDIGAGH